MTSKSSRARDEGAPDVSESGVVTSAVPGGQALSSSHTIPGDGPSLEDVQAAAIAHGTSTSTLPVDPAQIERPDPLGRLDVPTSAPSGAPAGSVWGDATVDRLDDDDVSQVNATDPGPSLGYVVAWAKAAVHVDASKAQTRTVGEGDEQHDELYVTVASATGRRDVVLEGQQVTLNQGEALPPETVPGQGAFLVSIGAAIPLSIPASS